MRLHHGAQYLAQNLLPVHLGLGTAAAVDSLVVEWPSGQRDRVDDVPTGRRVRLIEGVGLGAPTADDPSPRPSALAVAVGPNPARGRVTVRVASDGAAPVRLDVFDVLGRRVHTDVAEGAGPHGFVWEGARAAGTYVVRVTQGEAVRTARVVTLGR